MYPLTDNTLKRTLDVHRYAGIVNQTCDTQSHSCDDSSVAYTIKRRKIICANHHQVLYTKSLIRQ